MRSPRPGLLHTRIHVMEPQLARAFVDGQVTSLADARVPVTDRGLRYGEGVFEVLRTVRGRPFLLDRHLARLATGGAQIGLPPIDDDAVALAVHKTLEGVGGDARVRILVTAGDADELGAPAQTRLIVTAEPLADPPRRPADLVTIARPTCAPATLDPQLKTLAYLDRILALRAARAAGADDAIRLDSEGWVAECGSSSLLLVCQGVMVQPASPGALTGITAAFVAECLRSQGHSVVRRQIAPSELREVQAALIASSVRGVRDVRSIDGRLLPGHPLTETAKAVYDRHLVE